MGAALKTLGRALTLLGILAPALGSAQADTPDQGVARQMGGHDFILSEFVPAPFAATEFALLTGAGFASLKLQGTDATGTVNPSYRLATVSQSGRFQLAVTPWLALRAGGGGNAIVGVNSDAALAFGGDFGYGYGGGAQLSIPLGPVRLGGSFDIQGSKSYHFNIDDAIRASLQAGRVTVSTLLSESSSVSLAPGAQVAVGFHPAAGAYAHVRFVHESQTGADTDVLEIGAALSLDLRPITQLPVGFLVSYNFGKTLNEGGGTAHQIGGGVFYTGRRSVSIGVEARATFRSPSATTDFTIIEAVFGMRYYW